MAVSPDATAGVDQFPYPDFLPTVIRTTAGDLVKGFVANPEAALVKSPEIPHPSFDDDILELHTPEGVVHLDPSTINQIFFVRSLQGSSERHETKFLDQSPGPASLWVRVQCSTGETLEGATENNLQLVTGKGFFLRPADEGSNNVLLYLVKAHLRSFAIMGTQNQRFLRQKLLRRSK